MKVDVKAPFVPGESLGGLRLGVHIQEYYQLLTEEDLERSVPPDHFRWQAKPWHQARHIFAVRYELPPIAVTIDVRDGIVYELAALSTIWGESPVYEGSYNGIKVGSLVSDAMAMDGRFVYDVGDDCFKIAGVDGLAFSWNDSLGADVPEEWWPSLYLAEISVFLPERGLTPILNRLPQKRRD
jgi:hypothetical protein